MSNLEDKTVGIIGGLGPAATFDFCQRIVRLTPVEVEQDHLRLLVDNNPKAPDRNRAIAGLGPTPDNAFAESAKRLEQAGADFLVMPCNTAHAFADAITGAVSIPFVHIIDEAVARVAASSGYDSVIGLMAADGCVRAELYQSRLIATGRQCLLLESEEQKQFMHNIYRIKQSGVCAEVKSEMKSLAQALQNRGVDTIIAGCTEVPLALGQSDIQVPLFDSTEWLAKIVIDYATGKRPKNLASVA
ncbi:MAG: amino acid racemase [Granulosicoccus sp.]|nr:amino acid racemase [Granulosicoccus sp.]